MAGTSLDKDIIVFGMIPAQSRPTNPNPTLAEIDSPEILMDEYIQATIHNEDYEEWILLAVYASPNLAARENLWEELEETTNNMNQPSLVAGDFNDFTVQSERRSFSPNHNFNKT
ncbi:hypothetical protein LOK49_LG02G03783 [Camellia lanceoleosa]|uniref:Uncharacterized protein n=1 Tax=Camellia lanceoleosa TaxID=1840588 RepID=A0ACC0ILK5_9ERIC|nr:hypothetical protein LOK49_LG02G03783 [Camellia lanceoleosa]